MGKSKQKRFKVKQQRPTGLPSVKDFETEIEFEETSTTNFSLQPIIEQLSSVNEETRECGCASLANLVSNPAHINILLQKDCIKILAPLFVDTSPQVSIKALGAVRNITVDGGIDACEVLVKKDVLTPLVALFSQFEVGWNPDQISLKKLRDLRIEIFTEATHILWNLCEASEEAVKIFNKENLVHLLWPCLQYKIYGYELSIAVAQCLQTVTEENKELIALCRLPDKASLLESIIADDALSSQHALLKTLVVGIITNISDDDFTSNNLLTVVVQTLSHVLMVDAVEVLRNDVQGNIQETTNGNGHAGKSQEKEKQKTEKKSTTGSTDNVTNILKAQQIALEIITNICCSEDDWEEVDTSESSSDEMSVDVNMEETSENFSSSDVSTEVQNAITSNHIFTKVLQKIEPVEIVPLLQNIDKQTDILKSFERLQIYALLCCNNLVSSLEITFLGGMDNLHTVWSGLVKLASSQIVMKNLELLEAVTSCMRAVVQKLADLESPKLLEVSPQDLQFLYEMEQQCGQSDIKVNAVRIVSTIGCVFAKQLQPNSFLKDVGMFLLEICCKENDLRVIAESLDAMFDVFGEDHLDPIVREIQMVEKLKTLLPSLKSQIQNKKKSLGEHYPVISTSRINLIRFIKYKTQSS